MSPRSSGRRATGSRAAHQAGHQRWWWPLPLQGLCSNQALPVQVEDGVGDDAGGSLLVPPGRHHEDGDAVSPRRPEQDLVSLHDALAKRDKRRAVSRYRASGGTVGYICFFLVVWFLMQTGRTICHHYDVCWQLIKVALISNMCRCHGSKASLVCIRNIVRSDIFVYQRTNGATGGLRPATWRWSHFSRGWRGDGARCVCLPEGLCGFFRGDKNSGSSNHCIARPAAGKPNLQILLWHD